MSLLTSSCNHSSEILLPKNDFETSKLQKTKNDESIKGIVQNVHLRNLVKTVLRITAHNRNLMLNYTQKQKTEFISVANEMLKDGETSFNPLGFVKYDKGLYAKQAEYLLQEVKLFNKELSKHKNNSKNLMDFALSKVISDIQVDAPDELVANSFTSCVAEAVLIYADDIERCGNNASCQAVATGRLSLRVSLCAVLN